jgi:hypothetical protein
MMFDKNRIEGFVCDRIAVTLGCIILPDGLPKFM